MNAAASSLIIGYTLVGGLWPFGGSDSNETIGELDGRDVEFKQTPTVEDAGARAREQYRMFLELSSEHPELQMEAMRRLGDLNVSAGETAALTGAGGNDSAFFREAIKLYVTLLEANPDYTDADRILYQIARSNESIGQPDEALVALDQLVANYPGSEFFDEAQFRRGEILFVEKRFEEAEDAYAAVISDRGSSAFFEQSLYKHGWAAFKLGKYDKSLDSFMVLLDGQLVRDGEASGTEIIAAMPRPQRALVDDTFRVLSITFSYLDGFETIDELLSGREQAYYADLLYSGLGDLYLDKERYSDAAKTYAAFVSRDPIHPDSPRLQVRVIEAYTLGKFPSLVLDAKRDYVDLYGLDSEFWAGRSIEAWPVVIAQLKEHLTDLAAYDHAQAQQTGDAAAYERAAQLYRRYLDYFPEDPDSSQRNFLLAEILFELQRFDEAAAEYQRTAYEYGPHEKAAEAGYAALVSARNFEEGLAGEEKDSWRLIYIDDALRFAEAFPEHKQAAAVLTTVAEELFQEGERERAVKVAGLILTMQPPPAMELERTAWTVIAHSRFDMRQYAEAEAAYQRLRAMPVEDPATREEIEERIAASVYRQAEQAQADGDIDAAVTQFLRVSTVHPGSEFVPNAIYDAAALMIVNERWPEAVGTLERFRAEFPDHAFQDDATQKLAVVYEKNGQPARAAVEYERISALPGLGEELHREALWRAAELYENAGAVDEERRVYTEIATRYPYPLGESMEARSQLAELARESGDWSARTDWLESIVAADADAGAARTDRSRTLAAEASLELAELVRDAFLAVRLTAPLKDSLKLKKERMETALQAYGRTAEYGVAEVTTAATFEIADLYYRLSKDLMASDRPGSLTPEELEQYEILLEEQAFPFEEQAIEIFTANAERAADGIYDQWVRESFARLAELVPARYAKNERSETLVAQLD